MFASQAKTKQQKDWLIPNKTITHMEKKKKKKKGNDAQKSETE